MGTATTPTGEAPDGWWRSLWRAPSGRWPGVRWTWSLLVPLGFLLWLVTWIAAPQDSELMTLRAESQVTGEGLAGARIVVGDVAYRANEAGEIRIEPVPDGTSVQVSATGHETLQRPLDAGDSPTVTLTLAGVLVLGAVNDAISGQPVKGTEITVVDASGTPVTTTRTDESGTFVFKFIPEDASLVIHHDIYGDSVEPTGGMRTINVDLDPPPVTGRIVDGEGTGIGGAKVSGPTSETTTGDDGGFKLDGVGQGSDIRVIADGLEPVTISVDGIDLGDIVVDGPPATPEDGA